jgi:hypothetical protein
MWADDRGAIRIPRRLILDDLRQRQALPVTAAPVLLLQLRRQQRVPMARRRLNFSRHQVVSSGVLPASYTAGVE